jgi:hypothetical protein
VYVYQNFEALLKKKCPLGKKKEKAFGRSYHKNSVETMLGSSNKYFKAKNHVYLGGKKKKNMHEW